MDLGDEVQQKHLAHVGHEVSPQLGCRHSVLVARHRQMGERGTASVLAHTGLALTMLACVIIHLAFL